MVFVLVALVYLLLVQVLYILYIGSYVFTFSKLMCSFILYTIVTESTAKDFQIFLYIH